MNDAPSNPIAPERHVFISYASQDAAVASSIVETLEGQGIMCWIAPRDVTPGAHYADEIIGAISGAKALILVLSDSALASKHVSKEVERAASKGRPIIALRLGKAPLTPALEYFLSESQWIEAPDGHVAPALLRLAAAVQHLSHPLQAAKPGAPGRSRESAPSRSTSSVEAKWPRVSGRRLAVLALITAAALAYYAAPKFWPSKRAIPATVSAAATPNVAISDKSIAVLPFADMSETHDQEYFADGMAEEILDLLAKIPGLTVIGRTSSFQFKGKNEDLRTIGAKLNAAYVLEGSVRKSGDQVRITAQLINTRTGTHEWSETYDRPVGDVLKLQDAIAAAVVRELQITIASGYLQSRDTLKDVEVYELLLRGRHAFDRFDTEGFAEAETFFQRALDRDPTSADAAAELAFAYDAQGEWGYLAPAAAFEKARRLAAMALTLDPKNVRAHYVLGLTHTVYDWDWAAANREFQQVATLAPGSADALIGQGLVSRTLGLLDDALRQVKAALAQDPLSPDGFSVLAKIHLSRGQLREAEASERRVLSIRPTYGQGRLMLGWILLMRGERDGALLEMQQETDEVAKQQGLAMAYYALGRKSDSDAALARMLKEQADGNAYGIAEVYGFRGQSDETIHWLERAYAQKDPDLYMVKASSAWSKTIKADPRFKAFLRKMNLPE